MHINYREWDSSGIVINCGGRKYLVAPRDLVLPNDEGTRKGLFDQAHAKEIEKNLACSWAIPTYEQMIVMVTTCKDMKNGNSYWINNANEAYNPARGCHTPQMEIDSGMLACRIRPVCDLLSAME